MASTVRAERTLLLTPFAGQRRSSESDAAKLLEQLQIPMTQVPEQEEKKGQPSTPVNLPVPCVNVYGKARGHVQRVVDVALLINNMSRLATVLQHRKFYTPIQVYSLVVALSVSMIAQVVAGVCFFAAHQRNIQGKIDNKRVDYTAYACVGIVMVLNIFISTFDASWSAGAYNTHVASQSAS